MCGIAGIYHYDDQNRPVNPDILTKMTRSLAHRGPDDEGFYIKGNLGLGHRRLSIVDLSPTGAQPMPNDDRTCWISYNGEFYNHREFRPRLEAKGARFRGPSDTETLLRLIELEGPDSLAAVSGIFAFAYWDAPRQTLTLARDHLGVKQVYYHDNGRRIVFASEIKALLKDPDVPREIDPEAVNQYLHFHTALFERTFFRNIRVLRAGEYLQVTPYGAHIRRYWSLDDFHKSAASDSRQVEDLREHLTHIVGQQLMSDVPVGSFFSGGIDSSAIAAHASKSGTKPLCFGVHFSGQGVTDERPYQESAAKALGLDLQLITMDGSTFPEDFRRLMYHQDEPVIGAAMFPMSKVSELAARQVKVCLGGQAADEIFGGYARYALGRPLQVVRSWFQGRHGMAADSDQPRASTGHVGGNLMRQFAEGGTISRLARNARHLAHWETSYFEHFAKVPEESWSAVFSQRDFCTRDRCRQIFHETVSRSPATDPLDKLMHWDVQTYLTGLFHQDDRMSMAASLESRVPFADPRLVSFAFHVDPDLKLRGGASKWLLRQAVSDVLPSIVLNRRKVGFDTPSRRWVTETHSGFVRDLLLSTNARQRGFWNPRGIESLLSHSGGNFDVLWKVLSIEMWASVFLDSTPAPAGNIASVESVRGPVPKTSRIETARHLVQECRELGFKGTLARGLWEIKTRGGLAIVKPGAGAGQPPAFDLLNSPAARLPFTQPSEVAAAMRDRLSPTLLRELGTEASEATRGRILCFSNWTADYGNPIDWHRDPASGHRWPADAHWTRVLRDANCVDVKFTWEAARFPHAYTLARAATHNPACARDYSLAFESQVRSFLESNPPGKGLHWFSGQEIALRTLAWLFACHVFSSLGLASDALRQLIGESVFYSGAHIAEHIEYARDSVYNNHLLSEALGLLVAGGLVPGPAAKLWEAEGLSNLEEQAEKQIYPDGAYIQQSHNYQRVAMQMYLWAAAFQRANGKETPRVWLQAMERSLDFLYSHQNPEDGWLPNFGANDGSRPLLLTSTSSPDFRSLLQALSVATRGERLYAPGPWDELSAWFFGAASLDLPLRDKPRKSVSFAHTGYHVLRGNKPGTFGAFRCGTVLDRFSQIDMLHLDIWWRGQNVLVDGGSYRYNGADRWHNHFLRTESHNTIQIDGHDQMLHFRQFKTLYWTEATLLRFEDSSDLSTCEGEHYGYNRVEKCTHRRAILFAKDDLWIVVDTVYGEGNHTARLHWLAGDFPWEFDAAVALFTLKTPEGNFCISVFDETGAPVSGGDVVCGGFGTGAQPPRGWQSRHYGQKTAVPSLALTRTGALPMVFVSILSAGNPAVAVDAGEWTVSLAGRCVRFRPASQTQPELVA